MRHTGYAFTASLGLALMLGTAFVGFIMFAIKAAIVAAAAGEVTLECQHDVATAVSSIALVRHCQLCDPWRRFPRSCHHECRSRTPVRAARRIFGRACRTSAAGGTSNLG